MHLTFCDMKAVPNPQSLFGAPGHIGAEVTLPVVIFSTPSPRVTITGVGQAGEGVYGYITLGGIAHPFWHAPGECPTWMTSRGWISQRKGQFQCGAQEQFGQIVGYRHDTTTEELETLPIKLGNSTCNIMTSNGLFGAFLDDNLSATQAFIWIPGSDPIHLTGEHGYTPRLPILVKDEILHVLATNTDGVQQILQYTIGQ